MDIRKHGVAIDPGAISLATLQTCVLHGARMACESSWADHGRTLHNDPFGRLYLVRSGRGMVSYWNRMFELRPGYLFVIPAFTPSRYLCPKRMDLTWLHFTATVYGSQEPFALFGWDTVVRSRSFTKDADRFEELLDLFRQGKPSSRLCADGLLRELLAPFADTAPAGGPARLAAVQRLMPALTFMAQRLADPLTLAEVARQVSLQPTYFSNRFTQTMGMTPIRYLNQRRVERAQALLRHTTHTLEEIAGKTGFANAFYLTRVFRRHTGMPPSSYRHLSHVEK